MTTAFYPIGTPNQPWGAAEKAQWLARQRVQRSYADEVLAKIDALRGRFDVSQYGQLDYPSGQYPLPKAMVNQVEDSFGQGEVLVSPFAMALACFGMRMTLEEALVAATLNAAWSLDLADRLGSLEPGKQCDVVLVEGDLVDLVRVGAGAVRTVVKRGEVVARN